MRITTITISAIAACLALAAPAAGAPSGRLADFRVSLEGVQTNRWTHDHASTGPCDPGAVGSGAEKWRFRTGSPVRMKAFVYDGRVSLFRKSGDSDLPLRGRLTRSGALDTSGHCDTGDNDGGIPGHQPPPPDCGSRTLSDIVSIAYVRGSQSRIELRQESDPVPSPFANCPWEGVAWPALLTEDTDDRPVTAKLRAKDLFGRRSKLKARATADYDSFDGDTLVRATIRWTVTFARVKPRR